MAVAGAQLLPKAFEELELREAEDAEKNAEKKAKRAA
jgi:hypothetical protein